MDYKQRVHGTINIKSLCVTTDYNQRLGDVTACKSIVLAWCPKQLRSLGGVRANRVLVVSKQLRSLGGVRAIIRLGVGL